MEETSVFQTPFDHLVTNEYTQILKALIPYLSIKQQRIFSIFLKTKELSNTISLFSFPASQMQIQSTNTPVQSLDVLKDIGKYCYGDSKDRIEQVIHFISIIELSKILNESEDNNYE